MKRINLSKVRRDEIRAFKKYEAFGTSVFGRALTQQAEQGQSFDPNIMLNAYIDFYKRVFVDSATREYDIIRVQNQQKDFIPDGFFLSTWQSWIENYVRTQLKQVVDKVNRNTFKNMEAIIAQGIAEGWQPFTLAQAIKDKIGSKARALAIARTEATTANAIGKQKSAQDWSGQTGQELYLKWIHGGSKEPRESHLAQSNMPPVKDGDVFPLTGLYLPGEISAPPSERINCSCTVVYMSQDYVAEYYPEALNPIDRDPIQQLQDLQNLQIEEQLSEAYKIAYSIDEAEQIAKNILNQNTVLRIEKVEVSQLMKLENFNLYNEQLNKLTKEYNISPHLNNKNPVILKYRSDAFTAGYVKQDQYRLLEINLGHWSNDSNRIGPKTGFDKFGDKKFSHFSKVNDSNQILSTLTHEFAHVISIETKEQFQKYPELKSFWSELKKIKKSYSKEISAASRANDNVKFEELFLGNYSMTNNNEFMAETFTEYKLNSNPSKYALEVGRLIDKYFKKRN